MLPEFYGVSAGRTVHKAYRVGPGRLAPRCGLLSKLTHWLEPLGTRDVNDPRLRKCVKCFGGK